MPKRHLPVIRQALRQHLEPGEQLLGMFAVWRLRRSVTLLVVTDRRLLTLGEREKGLPVVDKVDRAAVTAVTVERAKAFSTGTVVAETAEGRTHLGVLDYAADGSTFLGWDRVLATESGPGMPVIEVPGQPRWSGGAPRDEVPVDVPAPAPTDAETGGTHPLVAQLQALAELRREGALTEEEFVAAKARLLGGGGG